MCGVTLTALAAAVKINGCIVNISVDDTSLLQAEMMTPKPALSFWGTESFDSIENLWRTTAPTFRPRQRELYLR